VWEVSSGEWIRTLEASSVTAVSWSSDGSRICGGSDALTVRVWEVSSERCVRTLEGHSDRVTSVSWSSDGSRICSGSGDTRCECGKCQVGNASEHLRDTLIMCVQYRGAVMGAESAVAVLIRRCECGKCRVGNAFEHLRDTPLV